MRSMYRTPSKYIQELGFRSKLEAIVNQQLVKSKVRFSYEGNLNLIRYEVPRSKHRYLADFLLSNGIIIEAKGLFDSNDRMKHLLIKEQYPILDIRFLFQNSRKKIRKGSKTTYASWCNKNGFLYCDMVIPDEWLSEKKDKDELEEIISTLKRFGGGDAKSR